MARYHELHFYCLVKVVGYTPHQVPVVQNRFVLVLVHKWLAPCQYNVTGWVSMYAYDMLSQ